MIFELAKRSIITKIIEKDASLQSHLTLIIVDFTKNLIIGTDKYEYTLELSDGFKSFYSLIRISNPINLLVRKNKIYIGMKLDIINAQGDKLLCSPNKHYISLFYNSISKSVPTSKLVK